MSDWKFVPIRELGEVFDGPHATPRTVEQGPIFLGIGALENGRIKLGETRHVTSEDYEKWTRRIRPQPGDFVFSYETRLGEAALIPEGLECCLGRRMGLVRVNTDKIEPHFFLYAYISPSFQDFLRSRTVHGATVDRILIKEFPDFPFPCPPLPEQKEIARILSSLDDKIELNRRMNETLEAMARAIFKDWFVDFGPTRAKQEGRAAYLPEHLWSLFPEAIDLDTGLPQGWELATLGSIAESVNRTINPAEIDEQIPYIGLEHMPRRSIALSNWEGAGKVTSNKLRFETGEFLFGKLRPYFHKVGIAPLSGICSTDIVVVRAKSEIWSSLVLTAISTDNFVEYTNLTSTGTKMPRTSWSIMAKYELPLPAEHLVKKFEFLVKPCTSQIIGNIHLNRTLAELRDRLLPKLMSGEIRVKDAEQIVEKVM
jgi:type I restriction enzyme, S subunit